MKKGGKKKTTPIKEEFKLTLDEARERLWRAIPCIAQALQTEVDEEKDEEGVKPPTNSPTSDVINELAFPLETMQHIVRCLYMAIHGNPTPEDVDQAVLSVFRGSPITQQEFYYKKDLYNFLDFIPSLWLSHVAFAIDDVLVRLNLELVDCITTDEPPIAIIDDPYKTLLISPSVCSPKVLATPVGSFMTLNKSPLHKEIFCTLLGCIRSASSDKTTSLTSEQLDALTSSQFNVFFAWFIHLHFSNVSAQRSEMAARNIWLEFLNAKGEMDIESFKAACIFLCRRYAQQLNTASYLEKLLSITHAHLKTGGKDGQNPLTAISPEEVQTEQPRRRFEDPTLLYMPEDLRHWRQESAFYNSRPTENRILIHGPRTMGKTMVGKALAAKLHAAHLDVLELATAATADALNGDELGQQLVELVRNSTSIPLSLQAALIRREVGKRSSYEGYVFSDSLSLSASNMSTVTQFLEDCGLTRVAIPSVFLEMSSSDEEWIQEVQKTTAASQRSVEEALLARYTAKQERLRQEEEKAAMIASHRETLEHFTQLQNDKDVPEEELEKAREKAAEAEEILTHLANNEQDKNDSRTLEEQQLSGDEPDREDDEDAQYFHMMLGRLIESGRASLHGPDKIKPGDKPSLFTSLPVLNLAVERAALRDAILTVDATSSVEDILTYVIQSLDLKPTLLINEVEMGDALNEAPVDTLEDEKAIAQLKEETALANGFQYSPTWKRFCPVTFEEDHVLIEGSPAFSCTLRSYLYITTSRDKLEKFMRNPLFYLRRTPESREAIVLVADNERLSERRENNEAGVELYSLVKRLAHSLQLIVIPLSDYASAHSQYRELRDKRKTISSSRSVFDREERQQRSTRMEKRLRLEAKRKQPSSARKPNIAKRPSTKKGVSLPSDQESPSKVTFMVTQQPESIADVLGQEIKKIQEKQKNDLPVLMTALNSQDHNLEELEMLLKENAIPKNVLVLRYGSLPTTSDPDNEDGTNLDETLDKTVSRTLSSLSCDKVAEKIKEYQAKEDYNYPESIQIHEIDMLGMTEQELLWNICQRVSPAAVHVAPGVVDENLGAEEEDEEEEFLNEEDEEEEEDNKELKTLLTTANKIEPLLKPHRRFLHQFGSRLQYCPVTLYTKRLLVRGKNDFCLSFLDELYCFATEECLNQFQQNPLRFVSDVPPQNTPPRFWMVGATFSGRQTLSAGIQREFGIPFFRYNIAFLERCIEAAGTPGGAKVDDIFIPEADLSQNFTAAARGTKILQELRDFAADHERRLKLRLEAEKELEMMAERADEIEDEEEAAEREAELQGFLEFEPEDEEVKEERLNKAHLSLLACVTRMEPFESQGYVMVCSPFPDVGIDILFEENCIPEAVVYLDVPEDMHSQRAGKVMEQRRQESVLHLSEAQALQMEADSRQREEELEQKKRKKQLRLWLRRHIGANDDPDDADRSSPEVDGALRESQPRSGDLQGGASKSDPAWSPFSEEVEAVGEFLEILEERLVDVVRIPGGAGPETVFRTAKELLQRHLSNRSSFFCSPQVVHYEFSQDLLRTGRAAESCFESMDPVELFERRMGVYQPCRFKPPGSCRWSVPEASSEMTASAAEDDLSNEGRPMTPDEMDDVEEEMSEYSSGELEQMRSLAELKQTQWNRLMSPHSVLFASRMYYFKRCSTLRKFLRNPILYVSQPPPPPKLHSMPAVAIFGGDIFPSQQDTPNNGVKKRSLAESVAYNLNAVFISVPKLLTWAAVHPRLGSLSAQAIRAAFSGQTDVTTVERLFSLRLGGADVKWKGAILSDWPRATSDMDRLVRHPIPTLIARAVCVVDAPGPDPHGVQFPPFYTSLRQRLDEQFLYVCDVNPSNPRDPRDSANLLKLVMDVEALVERGRRAVLCRRLVFPISVSKLWKFTQEVKAGLSSYQWYCPYSWIEEDDLVDTRSCKGLWVAQYLEAYYFFSTEAYLQRFLLDPHVVAEPKTQRPLPRHLPVPITHPISNDEAGEFALRGCCPVLLYDTRDNYGLRGVKEGTAKLGSLSCVVEYNGKRYACLDEISKERFLKRPWQYIDEEVPLPPSHKCPLLLVASKEKENELRRTMDGHTYIKRYLYDRIARAMLAVAEVRPMYSGLTVEESVLKYMALYLKAHREDANELQRKQYAEKLDLFTKRSTLYKQFDHLSLQYPEENATIRELCAEYDMIRRGVENVADMNHLKMHSDVKQ
ncbi:unnamed protein product [Phytomonas sp. Hart1]|nr:unnamed protein product [Phytomonas sp. Hart1]|eukprot:CCW70020.1 unnamed protein product [Phytomonas sp. isolate Hart1]